MLLKLLPKFWIGASLCLILICNSSVSFAEGTKELDPNSSDYTKLMTNNANYGSFAEYNGSVDSRLFIHVSNPNSELVYLGLSRGATETFHPSTIEYLGDTYTQDYYFRILSPSGTVVYGPILVDGTSANVSARADAIAGPAPITGSGGYTPFIFDPTGLEAGDYYIEFSDQANAVATTIIDVPYFDITVANNAGANPVAVDGRVWSYNWAFKTTPTLNSSSSAYGNFDRAFNGAVYAYTDDGFVNKIDFSNSGFRGWFFTLAFNDSGAGNSGVVNDDRKSVESAYSVSPQYKIFFNDPDPLVYPTGTLGTITVEPQVNICNSGDACIWIESSLEGQVEIIIDIDDASGAGIYDLNTEDVLLLEVITALPGETAPYRRCVEWDGLDGLGANVNLGANMAVYISLQQGVTHYSAYDVEYVVDGYEIDIVRPSGGIFVDKLYYDDSNISDSPGNGSSQVELEGCVSPCHSWTNFDYGDQNTINTWWISNINTVQNVHIPWCPPTATEDTAYTAINTAITIDLLANDQGTGLWAPATTISTNPSNGSISLDPNSGAATYTPNIGFSGEDRFWYQACNADSPPLCDDTWVVIYINGLTAINDDNNTLVNEGISGNVLTNDTDNEGDDINLNTTPHVDPAHGGVVVMIDGSYTYTPSSDYVGQDQFAYIICDNGTPSACDTAWVRITVTADPSFANNEVIANADEAVTNTDVAISGNVLANDVDVDGNILTVNTTPTADPSNGSLALLADGSYTYTPNAGYTGQDQFAYEVCDDGSPQACAGAIVVIDIIPDLNGSSPNAPFAGDDFNLTNINTAVSGDLSSNDSGGGTMNTTPVIDPANGSVTINSDGTYTYTPTTSYSGPDQFVYATCVSGIGANTVDNYTSTDIPVTINDNTINSTLTVPSGGVIKDINVTNFNITHSWIGDLEISLTSPEGTTVTLFNRLCDNFVPSYDLTIDDEGTGISTCGDLNDGGVHQPTNGYLSDFDDENSTGTWTITITDHASGDMGDLNSWGLEIESLGEVCAQATVYLLVMPDPVTDLDEDNDGIPDLQEVFTGDHDTDGTPDYADPDFCAAVFEGVNGWDCGNGLPDPDFDLDSDGTPNIVDGDYPYTIPDSDGDGLYDYLDLDADNDGLPDLIEAGGTDVDGNGLVDALTDSDNDGLVDLYDPTNDLAPGVNEGTTLAAADTDNDKFPDYLDLDSDNDGIPDLLELGGVDSDGNGRVDDLTDSDTDGLVDTYDPANASNSGNNEGTPHFVTGADSGNGTPIQGCVACDYDSDGLAPHLDLDADNDGILDIIEAGGTDVDNDGMIADAVGDNGYSNGLDPEDGGTPYFTAIADDGADTNSRPEYIAAAGIGDSDGDDVPDFMDVDADNDGLYDNYEAQATNSYIAPINMDSDGDGIIDVYDADSPSVSSNGLDPYNHDLTDQPDYLDTDADNDNVPDWQEAWDDLFDGDSQTDNISGHLGEDTDGDGLLNVYDGADADPTAIAWEDDPAEDISGNNGSAAGTVFSDDLLLLLPENGGNNVAEPDYRDQLSDCASSLVYYALSEMGGSSTSYSYNSATGKHEASANTGATRATTYCIRDGWYYYFNPLEPTNYLFAVRYNASNPGSIPIEDLIDYIEIRLDSDISDRIATNGATAQLVMGRDWHVVFKQTAEAGATYDIKYYFDPANLIELIDESELLVAYSNPVLSWFKADQGGNVSFNPSDISADSVANMVDITSFATATANLITGEVSNDSSTPGNNKNFIAFEGLPSFSGGTALISMSAAVPVELSRFSAVERGCGVALKWATAEELNFSHFELERSRDGKVFTSVKVIDAVGKVGGSNYAWTDTPSRGLSYYRLRMVDWDGSIAYSQVESVDLNCGASEGSMVIYPNPTRGAEAVLHIACESPVVNPTFEVIDLLGRTLISQQVEEDKGWINTKLEVGGLPPGTYYLICKEVGINHSKKFLKIE